MSDAVRLSGVVKSYGAIRAVNDVDLTIGRGETVALLGPNGAGKSTTINMLLGLFTPDAGDIEVFGMSPARAVTSGKIGAMLQEGGFVPNATVGELIELCRALYPSPLPTAEILAAADLTGIVKQRVDKLSGGQSQRVRFAFALAGNPDLLVLDEPTAAMDVASRQAFWASMRRLTDGGKTVLFATHYLEEADDFADRVIVMAGGRIIADGSGAQIKKVAGGRTVSFDLEGASGDGLAALPGVTSADVRGGRVWLRCSDSDATVRALVQGGHSFGNLEIAGAGLEEAFLTLTSAGKE
ncbi:ABC-2 type transport system ATP-binding protein [Allocatelliglobosispora scoriae]|uniref:ABC-2 type transport system ATP-binding protein n=1 Tax=Allocatelliglobosispora scoriae TaxID=643052 RepID=A0A841BVZ2_9ACTN|nr:ABC transporter ATP-binding protein [Allocatelliglobosispora scoriae]MBB5870932.1 ABC-2 type transport system ATP-binding protein [Allocatelliglobosispora scoriae]